MENLWITYLLVWLILSLVTAGLYRFDKKQAIKNNYRVKEKTLLLTTFLFGSLGALYGLYVLRHKNRKIIFVITAWISFILHLIGVYLVFMTQH